MKKDTKKNRGKYVVSTILLLFCSSPFISYATGYSLSTWNLWSPIEVIYHNQQQKEVVGKVVDARDEPIAGANVTEAGTSNQTITDANGSFTLHVDRDAMLRISFLGYLLQEISTVGKNNLKIVMQEDTKALDEVVVIGYGETTRGDLTGSVASIKGDDLVRTGATSFGEALQGKLAGVQVNMQSGEPGASVNIEIRGANSISASSSPLYVIDGMQIDVNESEVVSSDVGGYTSYNPLASINPNDIE